MNFKDVKIGEVFIIKYSDWYRKKVSDTHYVVFGRIDKKSNKEDTSLSFEWQTEQGDHVEIEGVQICLKL